MIADVLETTIISKFADIAKILNKNKVTSLKERYLFISPNLLLALTDSISFSSERRFLECCSFLAISDCKKALYSYFCLCFF